MIKKVLFLITLASIVGCSATNSITMSVQEPAVVPLPSYMAKVGIINRSDTGSEVSTLERIDQILSAEGRKLDEVGARYSLEGVTEELIRQRMFESVETITTDQIQNPSFGVFPAPLSWKEVETINRNLELDGLFSLEFYDTDTEINYDAEKVTVDGPFDLDVPALKHKAQVITTIKTGWRIYDYHSKLVADEHVITEKFITSGEGINPTKAIATITSRDEIVKELSKEIGRIYAGRTIPYWSKIKRDYYVKGSPNLKRGKRRAQTGNWEGAAQLWLKDTDHRDAKIAGRAHYNMAIYNEIVDDLDSAIEWAQITYEEYGIKRALKYMRTLERRKQRIAELNQ